MANLTTLKLGTITYTIKDPTYTASDVLTKIKSVDGNGSGLDADLLDGYHANKFPYINDNGIWKVYSNQATTKLADNTAGLSEWAFGESRNHNRAYLGIIYPRVNTCGISACGTIAVFGKVDTHMGLAVNYANANFQVFGGNADKIVWRKKVAFTDSSITGNAASATKLAASRTINGTSFDGTANITTANWGTVRNITIGSTSKSVNGSSNVSWSLNEIGCPQVIDLSSYETAGSVLPTLDAIFKYGDNLTHHRTIYITDSEVPGFTNGAYGHVFCAEHDTDYDSEVRGHIYIVYNENRQYVTTFTKDDGGNVPMQILQAFGEAEATDMYTGLMSYIDKRKLDSINTSLYMPKSGGTFTGKIQFGNESSYIYHNNLYLSLQTYSNKMCISGTNDTELHINYKKAHNGHAPATFIWHQGSDTTYANHEVGQITVHGNINAPAYYQTSDVRYKNIIDNIEVKIEDIANLPIFNFNWKDSDNNQYCGTSAQEVQKILPNAVQGDDKLSLDYGVLATISSVTCAKELVEIKKQLNELKQLILDKNGK